MSKLVAWVVVLFATFGLGWYVGSRPPDVPPRPPPPTKADTVYVDLMSIPEIVQERVFVPGSDVPIPAPYAVEIFVADTVPCEEVDSRTRIMSAEFGLKYGDTTSVATESMSYENGSLVFRSQIERLYTGGMPRRIWSDSDRTMVEWVDFPVIRVNSCSLGTKVVSGGIGYGVGKIAEWIFGGSN